MISVSGKKWEQKKINKNLVDKLKQDFNFSDILSRLIISRKFESDEIATINADLNLNNVFLNNKDFNQSIKLVANSIYNKEKICILGDYDVDGSTATSLFVKFLKSINHSFFLLSQQQVQLIFQNHYFLKKHYLNLNGYLCCSILFDQNFL